jgi:hypothetical protein
MKKSLTEAQFQRAVLGLEIGDQTKRIAHGVLVERKRQVDFVAALGLTKGAVSQAVSRVWSAWEAKRTAEEGLEEVRALLPRQQAWIVGKWAEEAAPALPAHRPRNRGKRPK